MTAESFVRSVWPLLSLKLAVGVEKYPTSMQCVFHHAGGIAAPSGVWMLARSTVNTSLDATPSTAR
jgi:hypothetical protein